MWRSKPCSYPYYQEDELEEVHEEAAQEGQSNQIARDEKVNTHFVCLT